MPRRKGKQAASEADEVRTPVPTGPGMSAGPAGPGTPSAAATPGTPTATPGVPAPGTPTATAGVPAPTPPAEPRRRTARVRNRLIVAVAVVAAAIAGAAAPALMAASQQVGDSQELVDLATRTQQTIALSHSLADERDEVTTYIAAGRPKGQGLSEGRSARVDRQLEELRTDAPPALRRDLADITAVRRAALTGKGTALAAHKAYSGAITELHRTAEQLAEKTPPRAGSGAHAYADLDRAVEQASAARGLLLAALSVPRGTGASTVIDPATGLPTTVTQGAGDTKTRDELSAAAQQARIREQAALADFEDAGPAGAVASYDATVTGPDVTKADQYLTAFTDAPTLSTVELGYNRKNVDAALSARIDLMRGAESSLYDRRAKELALLRDDDVAALEVRIALAGVCLLVAVGVSMAMARTLTQPLSVLRRGSARLAGDPATEEPIKFTGRNDEFAQVVRSVNALHAHALALHERLTTLEADRKHLVGQRQTMADEREALRAELARASAHLDRVRNSIHGTFVNLALRTLGLVERQLGVIEGLEEREQDPENLATLFKLDHFATVMRRHSENLLVLAGAEHGHGNPGAVPLVDVVRAAVSEIERYERVRISTLPPHAHLAGFAADDLSHLVAEVLENATTFSPPDASVEVSGWLLENGEVMLSVQDEGIGMTDDRMRELNTRLASFEGDDMFDPEEDDGLGLGLYVVARLAARHGVRVQLREQKQGGVAVVIVLPRALLAAAPSVAAPPRVLPGTAPAVHLPGSEAEANSNVLSGRAHEAPDPLIAAAEQTVREAEAQAHTEPKPEPVAEPEPVTEEFEPAPEPTAGMPGQIPAESPAETTMTLAFPIPAEDPAPVPPQAPRIDDEPAHERVADETGYGTGTGFGAADTPGTPGLPTRPKADPPPAPEAAAGEPELPTPRTPQWDRVTDKGLPKRTPKISAPAPAAAPRTGSVDAEALRRRLGGFHQGAKEGRRDVEAEIGGTERTGQAKGDTVEEASS
ncbi:nitrate- and nitrite sensing domain-containing protein [Streptomyces sp. NPDC046821]|uniref:nitrate- and nitrite sensing domain-containing protein n=1 Tax=Streptomyces sp. NPDC046821 TaxID=3154702 RepID=UPI0033F432F8